MTKFPQNIKTCARGGHILKYTESQYINILNQWWWLYPFIFKTSVMTSTNGKHSRRKKFSIFAKDLPTAVKNLFTDHCPDSPFEQLVLTAGAFLLRNKANGIQHTAAGLHKLEF